MASWLPEEVSKDMELPTAAPLPNASDLLPAQADGTQATIEAMQLLNDKKFSSAEAKFQEALAMNETSYGIGHIKTIASVIDYSQALHYSCQFENAKSFLQLELQRAQTAIGRTHANLCPLLLELSTTCEALGCYNESKQVLKDRLILLEEKKEPNTLDVVRALRRLGQCCTKIDEKMEALQIHSKAAKLAQEMLDPDHPDLVVCYFDFATACEEMDNTQQSITWLRRTLALMQKYHKAHDYLPQVLRKLNRAKLNPW